MTTKLQTSYDLRKKIKVSYYEITCKGLIIDYTLDEKETTINCDPLQSCNLLKQAGLINSYEKTRTGVQLFFDMEINSCDHIGNHVQQSGNAKCYFNEYVLSVQFSQSDAIAICVIHARNSAESKLVSMVAEKAMLNITAKYKAAFI